MSNSSNNSSSGITSAQNFFFSKFGNWLDRQGLHEFAILEGINRGTQLGTAVVLSFAILDLLLTVDRQDSFIQCAFIRGFMAVICAYYSWKNHCFYSIEGIENHRGNEKFVKRRVFIGLVIIHIVANGTALIGYLIDGSRSNYFAGIVMVFVVMSILIPVSSEFLAYNMLLVIIFYVATLYMAEKRVLLSVEALSNLTMVIGGAVVSWFGASMNHRRKSTANGELMTAASGETNVKPPPSSTKVSVALFRVMLTLAFPIGSVALSEKFNRGSPEHFDALNGVKVNDLQEPDGNFEFRNTTQYPVTLEHAQIFVPLKSGKSVFVDVATSTDKALVILPRMKVRIYSHKGNIGLYFFTPPENVDLAAIQDENAYLIKLVGYRVIKHDE